MAICSFFSLVHEGRPRTPVLGSLPAPAILSSSEAQSRMYVFSMIMVCSVFFLFTTASPQAFRKTSGVALGVSGGL